MKVLLYETKNGGGCGKIVGEMTVYAFEKINAWDLFNERQARAEMILNAAAITKNNFIRYANGQNRYAWWLECPSRYRKPIDLMPGVKPPQSWRYYDGKILLSIHKEYSDLILSGDKIVELRSSKPKGKDLLE